MLLQLQQAGRPAGSRLDSRPLLRLGLDTRLMFHCCAIDSSVLVSQ